MMSQTTSDTPHLFEDDLPESANTERKIFAEWASSVPFKKQAEDFEIHNSEELDIKLAPFLQSLNLSNKVYSFPFILKHTPNKNTGVFFGTDTGTGTCTISPQQRRCFYHSNRNT
jgi:hypothetical protein